MSRLSVTNFSRRTGSPFKPKEASPGTTKMKSKSKESLETSKVPIKSKGSSSDATNAKIKNKELPSDANQDPIMSKEPSSDTTKVPVKTTPIAPPQTIIMVHEEVIEKTHFEKQKEKQNELIQKVTKKSDEYKSNKPSSGVFTEVVSHGAFSSKSPSKEKSPSPAFEVNQPKNTNGSHNSKSLLGFPSSANDLALDAKTDLESDPNISNEVKEKVIEKLFKLVSMVQHTYESKVRIMTEFEKFKDTHMRNEIRREKEHSEQLYKVNMNFQNEVVQAIQRLKSELDITRNVTDNLEQSDINVSKNSSVDFNTDETHDLSDKDTADDVDTEDINEQSPTQLDKAVND